jgi:hypothetical protein
LSDNTPTEFPFHGTCDQCAQGDRPLRSASEKYPDAWICAECIGQPEPWREWHLYAPREPVPDTCDHGRPDHQVMLRQLGEALGLDLPALSLSPAVVWEGLLSEVERRCR